MGAMPTLAWACPLRIVTHGHSEVAMAPKYNFLYH